ncbi:DUF4013 domain-containing protein [Candidatus Woesearchaeota archaeon]|nr:DUF4013 domain-containing protein [Candidatus Woesearchaeota archaeon]
MVDFGKALTRPFSDWKKFGIGFLMFVIPIVNIITQFFAWGYITKAMQNTLKGKNELPEWDDWGDLIVKGLLFFVVSLVYLVPAIIIAFVVMGSWMMGMLSSVALFSGGRGMMAGYGPYGFGSFFPSMMAGSFGGGFLLVLLIFLLTIYIVPSALVAFAEKGTFEDAFALWKIFKKAFTGSYLVAWLVSLLYALVVGLVFFALLFPLALTVIGPLLLMAFVQFMVGVTMTTLQTQGWRGK